MYPYIAGLGVDNIISANMVISNGDIIHVNATNEYSDLWWALRGGGGSTWGVLIDLTIKAHYLPKGGITAYYADWYGTGCEEEDEMGGLDKASKILNTYMNWSLTLDNKWSGLTFLTPKTSLIPSQCGSNWTIFIEFSFLGNHTETGDMIWDDFISNVEEHGSGYRPLFNTHETYASQWDRAEPYALEVVYPWPWLSPSNNTENDGGTSGSVGGIGSVLVSRSQVENGNMLTIMMDRLKDCNVLKYGNTAVCSVQQIYQDITGNVNTSQGLNISTNPSFRTALYHYVVPVYNHSKMESVYTLGNNSYFSEEAYEIGQNNDGSTPFAGTWNTRNYGTNYARLLDIKNKYDPNGVFWCRHCIGDEGN